MKTTFWAGAIVFALTGFAAASDIGPVDQKAPKKEALVAPKTDKGIETVSLLETFKGTVAKGEKRHLYFIVTPLSNADLKNTWWIQRDVTRDGDSFSAEIQFGEENAGVGEYFAVLAIATDKTWSGGDTINELPADAAYSKVKVVKRK
ncbi:MAG TPA: hypothetical protein VKS79_01450 [Gemmataceae bacterium]|nr:hypothetical protein [Gemmataceae bacterium]